MSTISAEFAISNIKFLSNFSKPTILVGIITMFILKSIFIYFDKGLLTINNFDALAKMFLNSIILFEIKTFIVDTFYYSNLFNNAFLKPKMNMTGITLTMATKTFESGFSLHFEFNPKENEIWLLTNLWEIKLFILIGFSFLFFWLMMYFNFKIYCKKTNFKNSKKQKTSSSMDLLGHLFLLTIFKCIITGLLFLAIKQKNRAVQTPSKVVGKEYFLSTQYYQDTYQSMESQTKALQEWYAISKLKFKSYKSFFQILILLSGDIAMNPGPTSYPCAKCDRGVRVGVFCKTCTLWIHQRCEGLSNAKLKELSQSLSLPGISTNLNEHTEPSQVDSTLSNVSTLEEGVPFSLHPGLAASSQAENSPFPFNETSLPENEQSFQFEAEQLQDILLEDETKNFKKKGLHFVHLNCNSLLSKIEEIREFVLQSKPHIICFSESKLDSTVNDEEVAIDDYNLLRHDRTRNGGGVACFIRNSIHFNQRTDFPKDFENIFIDILLPKTTPILFGVVYRPPSDSNFLELLSSSIMNSISFDAQEVYILGDINIDLLDKKKKFVLDKGYRFSKEESNYTHSISLTRKYVEFLRTYGLTQIIKEPTRVTDKTETLLDHILINTPDKITHAGVLRKAISDHDIIYCTRKHQMTKTGRHNTITLRSMKNYSKELFLEKLREIQLPNYRNFECINEAYQSFLEKIMVVIDKIAPLKKIRVKGSSKPWFDGEVIERIHVRDKLRKKYNKTKLQSDYDNFKNAQKQAKQIVKMKKCDYVKGQLKENIAKPSKLWKTLKSIGLPSKSKNESKICLKENEEMFFEPKETSRIFKNFYENLAQSLVNQLPPAPNKYNNETTKVYYDKMNINNNFKLEEVDSDQIYSFLKQTNASKAPGIDKLSGVFIIAKLKALYKKGSKTDPKNYRPISLLPILSKTFEKVIHLQTAAFLDTNNILYVNQSGFRPKHSTESCLTHLCDRIIDGCDSGCHTGMILIDLQKAFDTINHDILLDKMKFMRFSEETIGWFKSYLSNRKFFVNVETTFSESANLKCGVPQGSILGPLLFLLYINDLPQAIDDCDVRLYADDTCISFKHKNVKTIEGKLNKDFNTLCDWFLDNKLSIHFGEDKTKTILFSPKNLRKNAESIIINRHDVTLKQFSTVEYLGCLLDSTLSGEEMALKVLKKVNGRLRYLYRQGKYLNPRLRRMLCNALIQPHFDYACSAWYPNLRKGLKDKLQIAQNKCIRFCLFLGNREGIRYKHLKKINWLPVSERVKQFIAVSVYKFSNNLAPS